MSDLNKGWVENEIYKVQKMSNGYHLVSTTGEDCGFMGVCSANRTKAFKTNKAIQGFVTRKGVKTFRMVNMEVFDSMVVSLPTHDGKVQKENIENHAELTDFIHNKSVALKPKELIMDEIKWKYLVRSAVRAKNIMMTGPSGCGKTMAAKALTRVLDRPDFYFNLGATQDPRATLIGNTHFDKEKGTFFSQSAFVKAIQTPYAIILLDELSRAHPDAWNILMTPLDYGQRYLRLDEAEGSPIIKVAEGVTFISTANIGMKYTSTRVMDRALIDRFTNIEMRVLTAKEEYELLKSMFPDVDEYDLNTLAEIAGHTREQSASDNGKLTEMISTRATVETAGLLYDGFTLMEAAEIAILPFFSNDGGLDSERTYLKQLLQKYEKEANEKKLYNSRAKTKKPVADETVNSDEIPSF